MDPEEGTDPRTSISFAPSSEYDLVLFSCFSIGSSVGGLKVLTLMNFWDSDSRWHLWIGTFPVRVQPGTFGVSSVCSNVPCRPAGLINALDTKSAVKRFGFPLWETHIC